MNVIRGTKKLSFNGDRILYIRSNGPMTIEEGEGSMQLAFRHGLVDLKLDSDSCIE